ncbi:N-acetyltransferase [Silvibacterium dinghuense]|uniref:N-acetyltransferase n=2 Tax=Silvibacterium dinghuense TaxID=1560006 RepID=A0A4Q1SAK6_9BACT|nr:N-acetyltransferase [Silvibacterium dinghuense]GGH07976.1 hypothetical protein GCM10011586_25330 [Silvibacterium dinghuense]
MYPESNTASHSEQADPSLVFRTFQPGDEQPFKHLNEAWISRLFVLEDADHKVLDHPREAILERGGEICVAELDGEVVGCCALIPIGENEYELAKMTVSESARGRGLGRKLLAYTIAQGRRMGARRLYLESSHHVADAVHLYEQLGFRHLPPPAVPSPYARANIFMELLF